jgi:hypothetical protein
MKRQLIVCTMLGCLLSAAVAPAPAPAQIRELGDRIGEGVSRLGEEIRGGWAELRGTIDRFGLHGRVYSRLHWDVALQGAALDITAQEPNTIVLRGSVPDETAKRKAVQLARETVGVGQVIDELAIAPPPQDGQARTSENVSPNNPAPNNR